MRSTLLSLAAACWLLQCGHASAQLYAEPAATPTTASPAAQPQVKAEAASPVNQGDAEKPAEKKDGQPASKDANQEKAEKEKADKEKPNVLQRPTKPAKTADPSELAVRPDDKGLLQFQFRGQAWPDVLEWLAKCSGMSLDWQELPADYLNLTTQHAYTVPQTRDLINRHLLARGFTLLTSGEILSVVKLDKLDPALVPRVTPQELASLPPHQFVKVSFPLDWMLAERAAEEFKPMLSPHGKLVPLNNTNRLEAIDAAGNLQEIHGLLQQEQSGEQQERLVREFTLQHVRASDAIEQLRQLLGVEAEKQTGPMTPEQMQMMQQQAQMMQQLQKQGKAPPPSPEKPDIQLVLNPRKNSILALAPPDKIAVIEQAVAALDVESSRAGSLLTNPDRMQVYRLHSLDPEALVRTLHEVGSLEPATRLEVDTRQKAVIAYASLADHLTIRQLVERLDGSGRRFEVIRLRKLAADYVAGTIEFMMVGEKEKEPERPRYFFGYGGSPSQQEEQDQDEFRVDADLENNFLLLWANEVEIEEVTNLLVKLGEIPAASGNRSRLRMLDTVDPEELPQLLDRLRRAWPSLAPNPLELPQRSSSPEAPGKQPAQQVPDANREASRSTLHRYAVWQPKSGAAPPQQRDEAPPVQISVGADGRLILTSPDTAALDLLEELIAQLSPPHPDYEIFRLQYADAFYVKQNLEEFFNESDEDDRRTGVRYFFYDYAPPSKDEPRYRLSRRRTLKFIYDYDTNSILVHGADPQQLQTIRDLVALYDRPEPADSQSARMTRILQVKYSKAQQIADAVKDVYRDLLSANDKALAQQNPEERQRPAAATTYIFNEGGEDPANSERTHVSFKGKLSIGVDEVSNTLLVSAEGEALMRNIEEMVQTLDRAAMPLSTVAVVTVHGGTNAGRVREVIARMLAEGEKKPAATPAAEKPPEAQP